MDVLGRDLAPVSKEAFKQINEQAIETLKANLSARRFVDIKGPYGWDYAAVPVGRLDLCEGDEEVGCGIRLSVPLVESRVDFVLDAFNIDNIDRGDEDPDLDAVEDAAKAAAAFEDGVIYSGFEKAGIAGMANASDNEPVDLDTSDPEAFAKTIIEATYNMKTNDSIEGPYALVGGKDLRIALTKLVSGRTLFEVIKNNADVDEMIYTPLFDGAFLVSKRGGDFELTLGGDFALGYTCRDERNLKFYLTESFAFRILESSALTPLRLK